ncbi:MAG: SDR family oxidoreductase [Limisphaerales bacterium]
MNPPHLWITGAGGLVGHALAAAPPAGCTVAVLTRAGLDLTDAAAVTGRFRRDAPAAVIHCAGLTRNPACTADPALARRLNVDATRHLADLCAAAGVPLVFFSTDLVFDGRKGAPYVEADPVNPQGVYAETKAEAEGLVLASPRNLVLRTSLNYGRSPTGDRAFNEELVRTWRAGRTTTLFTDEFRCPPGHGDHRPRDLGAGRAGPRPRPRPPARRRVPSRGSGTAVALAAR